MEQVSTELDRDEKDSEEFKEQSRICQNIFEDLNATLNEEQQKKLLKFDMEYFMKAGQWKTDGFKLGLESGFKFAIQLIIDSMRN